MIDYGAAPATDEIELTLFGPGYGEAIAVHLGEGAWLLVDPCVRRNIKSKTGQQRVQATCLKFHQSL